MSVRSQAHSHDLVDYECAKARKLRLRQGTTTLVDLVYDDPPFAAAENEDVAEVPTYSRATANAMAPVNGAANGVADNFQVLGESDAVLWSGAVRGAGDEDDGEELVLVPTADIAVGVPVAISEHVHRVPYASSL